MSDKVATERGIYAASACDPPSFPFHSSISNLRTLKRHKCRAPPLHPQLRTQAAPLSTTPTRFDYPPRMNVTVRGRTGHYRTVTFDSGTNSVRLIEQRLLPHQFKIVATPDFRATAKAIQEMVVRGAGAIGATAAYGLAQGARAFRGRNLDLFDRHLE